jgi:hypothetical protein
MPHSALSCCLGALMLGLTGCATNSVTPQSIRPPDPEFAYHAIEAEPTRPDVVAIRDFDFAPSSVTENRSVLHRATDLFRSTSSRERRTAIGQAAAATLSEQAARELGKTELPVTRIPADSDAPLNGNVLLITGRLTDVNEGNRLARVWVGLGLGESRLASEVHVYRLVNGEKAEVLVFTTYADSGKMPGIAPSFFTLGFGQIALGPITLFKSIKDAASGGMKVYSSQIDHLAGETGDQIAYYLSQYAAAEQWIPRSKAKRVHFAG